jgi:hypothetical protein
MKLSQLVGARQHLLRCAHLANLSFAYRLLEEYATRIERARITGLVNLKSPEADDETCWAELTALEGHQSLIEEHFTDEDLMDLADAVAYMTDCDAVDVTFRIEHFADVFLVPLRSVLDDAGIDLDCERPTISQDTPRSGTS